MHILFLDESGKPDEKVFALGGVAIRADDWRLTRDRLAAALSEHGWPADRELKWHGCRTGSVPPAVADAAYATLASCPITCFVCLLRPLAGRQSHPELFASSEDTYATALTFLAERFQRFLAEQGSYGLIVLDSRRSELDERMRRFFERLREQGTPYLSFERLIDCLMFAPSHLSTGLQIADLVVGATLAARRRQGDASRWFKQLEPRFARHPARGTIDGVGVKVFPEPAGDRRREAPGRLFDATDQRRPDGTYTSQGDSSGGSSATAAPEASST